MNVVVAVAEAEAVNVLIAMIILPVVEIRNFERLIILERFKFKYERIRLSIICWSIVLHFLVLGSVGIGTIGNNELYK